MSGKKDLSLLLITLFTSLPLWAVSGADSLYNDGSTRLKHVSGAVVEGLLLEPKSQTKSEGQTPEMIRRLSLQTSSCGILEFELNPLGMICLNCRENRAGLDQCTIPYTNTGWQF